MSGKSSPIYLDYAATTPVDPRVAQRIMACLTPEGVYGNPASSHDLGRQAAALVEQARRQVAGLIGARPDEIIWTSGATESDNLAIAGVARFHRDKGKHIITGRTEHKAVLDTCHQLEREGFEVTYLVPDRNGLFDLEEIRQQARPDTILVSIMHVNNETGVIQDIAAIGRICREAGVLLHVDAAQSAGKIPIDLGETAVDLMSFSAHKIYGPKGAGALYVRSEPRCLLAPVSYGGGQEAGLRPGTLATHQIVGTGEAFRLAAELLETEGPRLLAMRERLWSGIKSIGDAHLNGHASQRAPGILNVCFEGVEGESLLFALRDLAISSGAACNSAIREPSYVLRAMGLSDQLAQGSLRFSLGRFTKDQDVDYVIELVREQVTRLRNLSPRAGLA